MPDTYRLRRGGQTTVKTGNGDAERASRPVTGRHRSRAVLEVTPDGHIIMRRLPVVGSHYTVDRNDLPLERGAGGSFIEAVFPSEPTVSLDDLAVDLEPGVLADVGDQIDVNG